MRTASLCIILGLVLCLQPPACAFDWKALHTEAETMPLTQALVRVQAGNDSPEDLYRAALIYLKEYKNTDAYGIFSRLEKNPAFPRYAAIWGMAEVKRRQHDLNGSQALLEEAIKLSPSFAPAYITMGYLQYILLKFDASARYANKVLQMGPDAVDISNYTRAYLMVGGAKGLLAHYGGPISKVVNGTSVYPMIRKAQTLMPHSPEVYFGLGNFYLLAPSIIGGDIQKAEENLLKTIAADPLFTDAYVRLSQVYRQKGDTVKAREYLDKALAIDPKSELALDYQSGACRYMCAQDPSK